MAKAGSPWAAMLPRSFEIGGQRQRDRPSNAAIAPGALPQSVTKLQLLRNPFHEEREFMHLSGQKVLDWNAAFKTHSLALVQPQQMAVKCELKKRCRIFRPSSELRTERIDKLL